MYSVVLLGNSQTQMTVTLSIAFAAAFAAVVHAPHVKNFLGYLV